MRWFFSLLHIHILTYPKKIYVYRWKREFNLSYISTERFHTFHRFHAAHAKDRICSSTTLHLQTPEKTMMLDFSQKNKRKKNFLWTLSHPRYLNKQKLKEVVEAKGTWQLTCARPLVMLFSMNCQSLVQPQHPKSRPGTAQDTAERIKACFSLCLLTFLLLTILAHHSTTKKSPTKYATFYYRYMRVCVYSYRYMVLYKVNIPV